ncbi:MAG: diheme cytochrome c-553 [Acidobacteriota bacterium]
MYLTRIEKLCLTLLSLTALATSGCSLAPAAAVQRDPSQFPEIERGRYLVTVSGCNDCHTPLKLTPNGPVPDESRLLSGHPENFKLGPAPKLESGWMFVGADTMTAFVGPWGVSYARNITSDTETGIGWMPLEMFVQSMRTGKHFGAGRPILPPMPVQNFKYFTDEDLKAIHAYLLSTKPVKNHVPESVPAAP